MVTVTPNRTGQLLSKSVVISGVWFTPEMAHKLVNDTIDKVVEAARGDMKGADLIVRDLLPTDLAETNNIWADATGATVNVFENSMIATQAIANERFVGIYGVLDTSTIQAVSVMRWTVAGAIVAIWSLQNLLSEDASIKARTGFVMTPLVVRQNQQVTREDYVRVYSSSTEIALLGITVEKSGRTMKA